MSRTLFNKSGVPLLHLGAKAFIQTSGSPLQPSDKSSDKIDSIIVENLKVAAWGANNDFASETNKTINSVGILNTGLKFIRNMTLGQGIFAVKITGYDQNGNELIEPVTDSNITTFVKSVMVRKYLESAARDYFKYGTSFVQLIPSNSGNEIVGINTINALRCRITDVNNIGDRTHCIVSGKWPDTPSSTSDYKKIKLLSDYDAITDLNNYKLLGLTKKESFIQQIKDSWSNNDYYSAPVWYSCKLAGWIDIAKDVPTFLKKLYKNQITMKWHIKIPYAYWDKKFPITDFENIAARNEAITKHMQSIEDNLCGADNAHKALFTMFEVGANGKAEEQWEITNLNAQSGENEKLVTSAAANSEIMFSLMLNPNVMGAGMPGGTYAGNQGGSNIREAFLVNVANAWIDRQTLLDPLETALRFNGADPSIELRFRNTILTTLDSGSGTKKVLS